MHVYTFWWMSLERPKCGQSQLEASTPRQCAVFRPSVLKITSPSSFCFCASSFCSVSTRTALRKERGSAGQHVWACARYWSEFFGHAQHLEPTWIYTLFHTQSFHTPVSNGPWLKNHVMSMTSPSTPLKVFEGWEADCVKPEAVALPTCSIWFASRLLQCPVLDCLSFYWDYTLWCTIELWNYVLFWALLPWLTGTTGDEWR